MPASREYAAVQLDMHRRHVSQNANCEKTSLRKVESPLNEVYPYRRTGMCHEEQVSFGVDGLPNLFSVGLLTYNVNHQYVRPTLACHSF